MTTITTIININSVNKCSITYGRFRYTNYQKPKFVDSINCGPTFVIFMKPKPYMQVYANAIT